MSGVFRGDVLGKAREKRPAVLRDGTEQTRPVTQSGELDAWSGISSKPGLRRIAVDGCLGLIDTDYCGVHLPAVFLRVSSNSSRSSGSAFTFAGRGF